jgi:hypothetical protein
MTGTDDRVLMMIIILVCVGFGTSYHLTNAYGMTGFLKRKPAKRQLQVS